MNGNPTIRTAARVGGLLARHLLALGVTVGAVCGLWTVVYVVLLIWAIFAGGGIGGPLAYPVGLLVFFFGTLMVGLVLLFPCTVIAEWFSRRNGLPIIAQLPISLGFLALLFFLGAGIFLVADTGARQSPLGVLAFFGFPFVSLLLPLGLYWSVAQGGPLLWSVVAWVRRNWPICLIRRG